MFIKKRFGRAVGKRRAVLKAVGVAAAASVFCIGCGSNPANNSGKSGGGGGDDPISYATFVDSRDQQVYKMVTIGTQVWMAQNLNYNVESGWVEDEWGGGWYTEGSKCYGEDGITYVYADRYDYWEGEGTKKILSTAEVQANCAKYGRLYDWETAMSGASSSSSVPSGVQGVCPTGWHLPSVAEWELLVRYVGGSERALKATYGWTFEDNGTNEVGFSALPGGYGHIYIDWDSDENWQDRLKYGGIGTEWGGKAEWWSTNFTEEGRTNCGRIFLNLDLDVLYGMYESEWCRESMHSLHSVRCVQD